ncbi:HlyD family efflux transporter periplasmic adaptor subunit [Chamaesiphon sp. VAR_48_metabat_135_sub]|uniref:HlyD family efflux transporter periplasmic adaptor subunit n=1 Tax=Chamaesiphon sp. VAR_48_metabat_135_sub TaxID=2964699 RepID=UPI00286BBAF2|nr:HlyD family efflux transporter periplasmic adaptor subunit [Chamaesiphon sp. VAR_48_metabat_135_sub]
MSEDNFVVDKFKSLNPLSRWIAVGASVVGLLILPAGLHYSGMLAQKPSAAVTPGSKTEIAKQDTAKAVTALGRLEPLGEVIKISAPSTQGGKGTLAELRVKEGDKVTRGQIIAVLDNRQRLEAAFAKAQEDVKVSQANLAKVKAGAKQGEIGAQRAEITRLESQLKGDGATYVATKARLDAQLKWEPAAQAGKIQVLTVQLAGEKPTQTATLRRLQSQLGNAEVDYKRYQQLYVERAIEATKVDAKRLEVETIRQQLAEAQSKYNQTVAMLNQQIIENQATKNKITTTTQQQIVEAKANYDKTLATTTQQIAAAKATLNKISEVRSVDVVGAQAELARARATARQAQAELAEAYVRAPNAGEILKVHSRAGESPSDKGIVEMGQTSQMVAVAEVYESDVRKLKVGQTASIKSESGAFGQNLRGTVSYIGLQIGKQDVLNTDPAADSDSRVVEVKIAIDPTDSTNVRGLTNSKIAITINTN